MTEETREVWALARRVDPSEPYDQWGVFEDGAAMAENVRNELEDELTEDEESEAGKAELVYTLGKIQPPADDANEWYVEAYDDDAAYHAVRVGFVPANPTWQETHPTICCACDGEMLNAAPEHMPIHVECRLLVTEED